MRKIDSYELVQGIASWVLFLSAGVAIPFTLEFWGVLNTTSLPTNYLATTAGVSSAVFASALVLKVSLAWALYRSYYLRKVSAFFFALGNKTLEQAYKG